MRRLGFLAAQGLFHITQNPMKPTKSKIKIQLIAPIFLALCAVISVFAATKPTDAPVHGSESETVILRRVADYTQRIAEDAGVATMPTTVPVHGAENSVTLLRRIADYTQDIAAKPVPSVSPKTFGCVIRPDASGNWTVINDAGHAPFPSAPTFSQSGSAVTITMPISFTKLHTAYAAPDEALALAGFTCGPSVSGTQMIIQFRRAMPMGGMAKWSTGTTFVWDAGGGDITLSWGSNALQLVLPHPQSGTVALTRIAGGYEPRLWTTSLQGTALFGIQFYDSAGNLVTTPDANCKVAILAGSSTVDNIWENPVNITSTKYPSSNVWIFCAGE